MSAEAALRESPKRIQRRRVKGWKMPPNTVYVGRPTRWGNPHKVGRHKDYHDLKLTRQDAVDLYREWLMQAGNGTLKDEAVIELHGKNLACFCPLDQPCHADVLLEIANG